MVLGEQAQLMLRPSLPYGEEPKDACATLRLDDPDVAVTAVLFNLAATPEQENHGAFLDYLVRGTPRGIAVLLDESAPDRARRRPGRFRYARGRAHRPVAPVLPLPPHPATVVNLLHPDRHPLELGSGLSVSGRRVAP
jgi:hypothetical protein